MRKDHYRKNQHSTLLFYWSNKSFTFKTILPSHAYNEVTFLALTSSILPMQNYNLVWFRQDLRISDHTALWHASQAGACIGVVILSPQQYRLHHDAPIKIDFYLRQLNALKDELAQLNIPLIVQITPSWADIAQTLLQLCQTLKDSHPIQNIYANIELGVNELKRDLEVQQTLNQHGQDLVLYHDRTLFPVGTVRNQSMKPYQVFSAFKKYAYQQLNVSIPRCFPLPQPQLPIQLPKQYLSTVPSLEHLGFDPLPTAQQNLWAVTEQHAHHLLDDFTREQMQDYQQQRDFPALSGTSQLSAYLNCGILSIRQCLAAVFAHSQGHFHLENTGQQTWLDELLWREFYQHILFDYPKVSKHRPFKDQTAQVAWRNDPAGLAAWQQGKTGIPIVDAGMQQLLQTGWMHNRVRMICAMFLCKNLLIDWRLGEQWFMQHLIDGDLAANNGGWQWCASTGTDAVPYFRIFNPVSQSQKFDPNGDYIRTWLPKLAHLDAKNIHEPYAKNPNLKLDYPHPIVDLKLSRLRAIEAFKQL